MKRRRAGEPEARQMAVYALGFFGGNAAAEHLRERVKQDEDRYVRFNAAVALGRRGDPAAAGTLREMLSAADLSKVIDLTERFREAEQDRGNRARSDECAAGLDFERSPELARSLSDRITELSKSGLVGVRSQAQELLQSLQSKP